MDRWRHVSQERLHRLPREPGFCWLCSTRGKRADLGRGRRCADTHDRIRQRERNGLRTSIFRCHIAHDLASRVISLRDGRISRVPSLRANCSVDQDGQTDDIL